MKHLLYTWLFSALGVFIAASTAEGISYNTTTTLIVVVLLLSFLNVVLKPIMVLLALPFVVLTLGLGLWVINALLFMLVGGLVEGFAVASFWSALWGALWVSLGSGLANNFVKPEKHFRWQVRSTNQTGTNRAQKSPSTSSQSKRESIKDDDVIDI